MRNILKRSIQNRCEKNEASSQVIKERGYIYGQGRQPQDQLRIGPWGRGGSHGCGPFAVYNALYALDKNCKSDKPELQPPNRSADPADIIRFFEEKGGFNLGGLLGSNPWTLVKCLKSKGHKAKISYLPRKIDRQLKENPVNILMYFWRKGFKIGGHYVMIRYIDEEYQIYNEHGNDTTQHTYPSIEKWITKGGRSGRLKLVPTAIIKCQ